jgi:hypothetical protein
MSDNGIGMSMTADTATALVPAPPPLPKCIQDALDQVERTRIVILDHIHEARMADEIVARHVAALPSLRVSSVGYGYHSLNGVLIYVDIKSPREVTALLRDVRAAFGKMKKVEDYAELRRRTYDFGKVKVMTFLESEDSSACRFVKVGEKTEPIYQLLCPDSAQPGAAPEAEEAF